VPSIYLPLAGGLVAFTAFLLFERNTAHPMLTFELFTNRNFTAGNLATVAIYAGLTVATFLLTVFVQQVAGYAAITAGLALVPVTLIMFVLSPVFGRLAARRGPRLFMTVGPVTAACGFALLLRVDASASYVSQILPGVLVFGLGLSATVAPLTAAVLGDINERHAGIGSAINNAIARVAGLLAVAAIGAVVDARFAASIDRETSATHTFDAPALGFLREARRQPLDTTVPPHLPSRSRTALQPLLAKASVEALHAGLWSMAALMALGGVISAVGLKNPPAATKDLTKDLEKS
jgi:predicted MFS family arabinose efflux permease